CHDDAPSAAAAFARRLRRGRLPPGALRSTMIRAAELTRNVTTNSTRPAAMYAPVFSGESNSAALLAIFDANVSPPAKIEEFHGSLPFGTDRMIRTATVSPSARPRPSIDALTTPERPYGRTDSRIISQRVAPRASAPSRCVIGVCAKTSRLIAVTT